jgi:hypothetical protein
VSRRPHFAPNVLLPMIRGSQHVHLPPRDANADATVVAAASLNEFFANGWTCTSSTFSARGNGSAAKAAVVPGGGDTTAASWRAPRRANLGKGTAAPTRAVLLSTRANMMLLAVLAVPSNSREWGKCTGRARELTAAGTS